MASRAYWPPEDIAVLEQHMEERRWLPKVAARLVDRSEAAIRKRMFRLRIERGLTAHRGCGVPCGGDNWESSAAIASARLAEALLDGPVKQPSFRIWCQQCDSLVDDLQADSCDSRWCKAKAQAA